MNPDPRSKYAPQPHIRFWCHGQIALSVRQCIGRILKLEPEDDQRMGHLESIIKRIDNFSTFIQQTINDEINHQFK